MPFLQPGLVAALGKSHYDTTSHGSDRPLSAADIGAHVNAAISAGADDVVVVHIVGHGWLKNKLYILGADGEPDDSTEVEHWITGLETFKGRPRVLFLLDVCHAAAAAAFEWQTRAGANRAWVVAAADSTQSAFDGRFTEAATVVLERLAAGDYDIHASEPYAKFGLVVDRMDQETTRLAAARGGSSQRVRHTPFEKQPELPFFPNPAFRDDLLGRAAREADRSVRPFLDEVADPEHFRQRASGLLPSQEPTIGFFSGRDAELTYLAGWLDGRQPGGLVVVTGSPGSGKSALLGVVVCAAHRHLRDHTRPLWHHLAAVPARNKLLVAVHARQRSVDAVVASIVHQLQLGPRSDGWTAERLITAVRAMPRPPILVLDALDEASSPGTLLSELLLPLTAIRGTSTSVCRLLVGVRSERRFDALFARATVGGRTIDLDDTPAGVLRASLERYVAGLLSRTWPYDDVDFVAVRDMFAGKVSDVLAPDDGPRTYGEFLIAAIYTNAFSAATAADPVTDPDEAGRRGAAVPATLGDLLNLDLASRVDGDRLRRVLAAAAQARGDGMPGQLLGAIAATDTVREDLDAVRFYLRAAPDVDGITLYRLFHQHLAEHLADQVATADLQRVLLEHVPRRAGAPDWSQAAPYLRRHLAQHVDAATFDALLLDAEFVVQADPPALLAELHRAYAPQARRVAATYRTSAHTHRRLDPEQRRQVLMIDSLRHGLAGWLHPPANGFAWRPAWATSGQIDGAVTSSLVGHRTRVQAIDTIVVDDRPLAVSVSDDGTVRTWDLRLGVADGVGWAAPLLWRHVIAATFVERRPVVILKADETTLRTFDLWTGEPVGPPMRHLAEVDGLAVLGPVAVAVAGRIAYAWDIASGVPVPLAPTGEYIAVGVADAIVLSRADGSTERWPAGTNAPGTAADATTVTEVLVDRVPVSVTGHADGTVRLHGPAPTVLCRHTGRVNAVVAIVVDGSSVVVSGADDGVVHVVASDARPLRQVRLARSAGAVTALCGGAVDGRPIVLAGCADGEIRLLGPHHRPTGGRGPTGHGSWTNAVAHVPGAGAAEVVTGSSDGSAVLWNVRTGERIRVLRGHEHGVFAVSCTIVDGRPLVLTGGGDGRAVVWDAETAERRHVLGPHDGGIFALACADLGGRPVAATGSNDTTAQLWDLRTGEALGPRLRGHTGGINAATFGRLDEDDVLVTAADDGAVRIWSPHDGRQLRDWMAHDTWIHALACLWLADGTAATVSGDSVGRLRWWNLRDGAPLGEVSDAHAGPVYSISVVTVTGSPTVLTAGQDGLVRMWDLDAQACTGTFAMPQPVPALSASPSGTLVAGFGSELAGFLTPTPT